jgi:hypothetical protein
MTIPYGKDHQDAEVMPLDSIYQLDKGPNLGQFTFGSNDSPHQYNMTISQQERAQACCYGDECIVFQIVFNVIMCLLNTFMIAWDILYMFPRESDGHSIILMWFTFFDIFIVAVLVLELAVHFYLSRSCLAFFSECHNIFDIIVCIISIAACLIVYAEENLYGNVSEETLLVLRVLRDVARILRLYWFFTALYANVIDFQSLKCSRVSSLHDNQTSQWSTPLLTSPDNAFSSPNNNFRITCSQVKQQFANDNFDLSSYKNYCININNKHAVINSCDTNNTQTNVTASFEGDFSSSSAHSSHHVNILAETQTKQHSDADITLHNDAMVAPQSSLADNLASRRRSSSAASISFGAAASPAVLSVHQTEFYDGQGNGNFVEDNEGKAMGQDFDNSVSSFTI